MKALRISQRQIMPAAGGPRLDRALEMLLLGAPLCTLLGATQQLPTLCVVGVEDRRCPFPKSFEDIALTRLSKSLWPGPCRSQERRWLCQGNVPPSQQDGLPHTCPARSVLRSALCPSQVLLFSGLLSSSLLRKGYSGLGTPPGSHSCVVFCHPSSASRYYSWWCSGDPMRCWR